MEDINFSKVDGGFHIEGFPNAVKVVQIEGRFASQLAACSLHHFDLRRALDTLEAINHIDPEQHGVREALWQQAIILYIKCFRGNKIRYDLDEKAIYKGEAPEAFEIFGYFLAIRNKNIVHDENSFAQCLPGAVLNKRELKPKIAKVVCMNVVGSTLGQADYSNLHLLITKALEWVRAKYDSLCDQITRELEEEDYDSLLQRQAVTYSKPDVDDVGKTRARP